MPDIGFIIPGNSVPDSNATHPQYDIVPDNGMTISSTPDIATSLVSGSAQRGLKGINPVRRTFNLTFNNREPIESDYIIGFFRQRKGVESFLFTLYDVNGTGTDTSSNPVETYEVVCDNYNVTWVSCSYKTISATFSEVQNTTANYIPTTVQYDDGSGTVGGAVAGELTDTRDEWENLEQ